MNFYITCFLDLLSFIFFLLGIRVINDYDSRHMKYIILSVICLVISVVLFFK